MRWHDSRHVAELIEGRLTEIDHRIRELHRLQEELAHLPATAAHLDPDECPADSICQILATGV